MDCRQIQSHFTAYVDGDLNPRQTRELENHLDECPVCRETLVETRTLIETCHEFLVYPGAAYSFEALRARLADIQPIREVIEFLPQLRVEGAIPRYACAAMFLLLVCSMPLGLRGARNEYAQIKSPFLAYRDRLDSKYCGFLGEESTKTRQDSLRNMRQV